MSGWCDYTVSDKPYLLERNTANNNAARACMERRRPPLIHNHTEDDEYPALPHPRHARREEELGGDNRRLAEKHRGLYPPLEPQFNDFDPLESGRRGRPHYSPASYDVPHEDLDFWQLGCQNYRRTPYDAPYKDLDLWQLGCQNYRPTPYDAPYEDPGFGRHGCQNYRPTPYDAAYEGWDLDISRRGYRNHRPTPNDAADNKWIGSSFFDFGSHDLGNDPLPFHARDIEMDDLDEASFRDPNLRAQNLRSRRALRESRDMGLDRPWAFASRVRRSMEPRMDDYNDDSEEWSRGRSHAFGTAEVREQERHRTRHRFKDDFDSDNNGEDSFDRARRGREPWFVGHGSSLNFQSVDHGTEDGWFAGERHAEDHNGQRSALPTAPKKTSFGSLFFFVATVPSPPSLLTNPLHSHAQRSLHHNQRMAPAYHPDDTSAQVTPRIQPSNANRPSATTTSPLPLSTNAPHPLTTNTTRIKKVLIRPGPHHHPTNSATKTSTPRADSPRFSLRTASDEVSLSPARPSQEIYLSSAHPPQETSLTSAHVPVAEDSDSDSDGGCDTPGEESDGEEAEAETEMEHEEGRGFQSVVRITL